MESTALQGGHWRTTTIFKDHCFVKIDSKCDNNLLPACHNKCHCYCKSWLGTLLLQTHQSSDKDMKWQLHFYTIKYTIKLHAERLWWAEAKAMNRHEQQQSERPLVLEASLWMPQVFCACVCVCVPSVKSTYKNDLDKVVSSSSFQKALIKLYWVSMGQLELFSPKSLQIKTKSLDFAKETEDEFSYHCMVKNSLLHLLRQLICGCNAFLFCFI